MSERAEAALPFLGEEKVMRTYRLWFQKDREFRRFMRLRCEKVDVSLREVLTKGVHTAGADDRRLSWRHQHASSEPGQRS